MVPSFRFLLTVGPISDNGIRSIQSTATKFITKWLRLPRNATQAILFHLEALNCPHLPTERLKAKVFQLATISTSCHTRIQEINFNLSTPSFVKALHIPNEAVNILHSAQSSIGGLPHAKQLIELASASIKSNATSHWNTYPSMQTDRSNKPGAGKSSLAKDQGWPTCAHLFYMQHQTLYPPP